MSLKPEKNTLSSRIRFTRAITCIFMALCISETFAGNVLIAGDDWIFTNTGFSSRPADTANFARNAADFVTGDSGRSIHAYSNYHSLTQSNLVNTLRSAGYTYTTGLGISFDLPTLFQFDALFLGSTIPSSSQLDVLSQYVRSGGGLYIHAGLGMSNPAGAANGWNDFLSQYGLAFGTSFLGVNGAVSITSDHRLFEGVSSLYMVNSHRITGSGVIATTSGGAPLFAAYEVPEPATFFLFAFGAMLTMKKRRV